MRKHRPVSDRRQQIPDSVTLLQKAGDNAPPSGWHRFHRERCSYAPFAAHADAVNQPKDYKNGIVRRKAGKNFNAGVQQNVEHERHAPPVTIREKSEHERPKRPRGEAGGNGQSDLGYGAMKFAGDRCEDERQNEKIKSIECPAKEAGDHGIALVAALGGGGVHRLA